MRMPHHPLVSSSTWLLLPLMALLVASCGSGRTAVEGYGDEQLNGRRILVLLPEGKGIELVDQDAYAFARGVGVGSASETITTELRTDLIDLLDRRLDSNVVLAYQTQAVAQTNPLVATSLATAEQVTSGAASLRTAGRAANADYLVILPRVRVATRRADDQGRGAESAAADYLLVDLQKGTLMSQGSVDVGREVLTTPRSTYERLAAELATKLPFHIAGSR